ncbi:hypothetical protein KPL39_17425 [Clostridium gasigenes]|uniref:hypothetical protein n=1 Tax=Clostridium gasigenes TaxID=94869 RepID=UPI0014384BB7|nr:hypothetical protein [Clostridium gasigenes]MBU3138016.1 hypothetical protein [Clostridium gasigenes]NKF05675.1 hypothetical protein [Clostridium gasigenes]QSW19112.1 hypothetical protein J1C67_16465 [Clostridium gasigenes]
MQVKFNKEVTNITPNADISIKTSDYNELYELLSNAQNGDEAAKKIINKKILWFYTSTN